MKKNNIKQYLSIVLRMAFFPLIFYFIFFCILTYPLIMKFSTHFFADMHDGLQNIWNIWWVNKSVTELHQLPWYTYFIHYPYGISLLGHTLNPFNGFMGILLLKIFTLVETYNFIIIFSFVIGGVTSFLLAYYFSKSYLGSLLAGFIFTFSNYHFGHTAAHLQLVSLEWIPLFVLFWFMFIFKPSYLTAIASAVMLFLVAFCDYYYLFYCILFGLFIVIWRAILKNDLFFFLKGKYLVPFVVFIFLFFLTSGAIIIPLFLLNLKDHFLGSHLSWKYSSDLLSPFIPGKFWRFSSFTQFFWSRQLSDNWEEYNLHLGISVIFLLFYLWFRRHKVNFEGLRFWYFTLIFFFVMSLGPILHLMGKHIFYLGRIPLITPYSLFEILLPPLKLSGCPVRMMVMVFLSASVICAMSFKIFYQKTKQKRFLTILLFVMLFFEYLPQPISTFEPLVPEYVKLLKNSPNKQGILDIVNHPAFVLYCQTIHEKPVGFGYVSRIASSTYNKGSKLTDAIVDKDYIKLYCDYNFRYFIVPVALDVRSKQLSVEMIYSDNNIRVYDLCSKGKCCQ